MRICGHDAVAVAVTLLLAWAPAGFALTLNVVMLTQMDGKVEIVTAKEGNPPASAFLKVALGDKVVLGRDARVQIVYFEPLVKEAAVRQKARAGES